MKKNIRSWVFIAAVMIGAIALAIGYEVIQQFSALPVYGQYEENGRTLTGTIPAYTLQAQDGGFFHSQSLDGKVVVTNFFFTSCPTVCPKMMRNMQGVHELYRGDDGVRFVSMSVDPVHDTPKRLKEYADMLNADTEQWRFLTGDKVEIYRLARNAFHVSAAEGNGAATDFIHSENLVLTDGQGRIRGYYNGLDEKAMDQLTADILKLKKERS